MLFSLRSLLVLGALTAQVSAHSIFTVDAASDKAAVRGDVTSAGSCNVAGALAGSTVTTDANGGFTALAKFFNAGTDAATTIKSATFDANADGKKFAGKVTVVSGGVAKQTAKAGTDNIKLSLPAGTICKGPGGACLVQLSSTAGFGNCVAVIPAAGKAPVAAAAVKNKAVAAAATTVAAAAVTAVAAVADTSVAAAAAAATSASTTTNNCPAHHKHRCAKGAANAAAKKVKARTWKETFGFSSV